MRVRLCSLAVALIAHSLHQVQHLSAQTASSDEAAVLAVADSALAAVTRADFIAFTDLMLDSAVTFSAGMRNGEYRVQFRSRAAQKNQTELVAMITPQIIRANSPGVAAELPRIVEPFMPPLAPERTIPAPPPAFPPRGR